MKRVEKASKRWDYHRRGQADGICQRNVLPLASMIPFALPPVNFDTSLCRWLIWCHTVQSKRYNFSKLANKHDFLRRTPLSFCDVCFQLFEGIISTNIDNWKANFYTTWNAVYKAMNKWLICVVRMSDNKLSSNVSIWIYKFLFRL